MLDTHGAQTNSFRCADCMQIELEFNLDEPVDRPLIQYSLCNVKAKSYFGTNSELLGTTLPRLAPGRHVYRITLQQMVVGIPSTFSTDTRRPSPTKCTSDETAGSVRSRDARSRNDVYSFWNQTHSTARIGDRL